jgi:hypothetical protein
MIEGLKRGSVIYTGGWVVGYVIACVFYIYITLDNGYTMAKYIDDFRSLASVYMIAYFSSFLWFLIFRDYFEKNKKGWVKRASLSLAVMGVSIVILATFFGISLFPFNLFGNGLFSILLSTHKLIVLPAAIGLFIVRLFVEALGVEYS